MFGARTNLFVREPTQTSKVEIAHVYDSTRMPPLLLTYLCH